ncbi:helix-turn-helix domain-containing protein, partial [Oscillospiraceae bacterium 38-13]
MKISYKPLWKTLIDKNMSKKDLRLQAHLTTNHIANMGKGEHISMQTLIKICETLSCDVTVSSQVKWAKFRHKVYQCRGEVSPG